jgi:hypothetical protein
MAKAAGSEVLISLRSTWRLKPRRPAGLNVTSVDIALFDLSNSRKLSTETIS